MEEEVERPVKVSFHHARTRRSVIGLDHGGVVGVMIAVAVFAALFAGLYMIVRLGAIVSTVIGLVAGGAIILYVLVFVNGKPKNYARDSFDDLTRDRSMPRRLKSAPHPYRGFEKLWWEG